MKHAVHFFVGNGLDAWCGLTVVARRGLAGTRDFERATCKNCLRSYRTSIHGYAP